MKFLKLYFYVGKMILKNPFPGSFWIPLLLKSNVFATNIKQKYMKSENN